LLPLGCAAVVKPGKVILLKESSCRFWGRCAPQRERAPSPQFLALRGFLVTWSSRIGRLNRPAGATAFPSSSTHLWRGSLLPLGCAAVVKPAEVILLKELDCRFWGRCAPQREQAPSPQLLALPGLVTWSSRILAVWTGPFAAYC